MLGRDCTIGANANIGYALVGDRVIVHGGANIGCDGFGFAPGATHIKIPQIGRVILQADVEIGGNSVIDRGALGDTIIGEGSKIDNLVHIAHNVQWVGIALLPRLALLLAARCLAIMFKWVGAQK